MTSNRSSHNTQYDWILGAPEQTDNTNFDWVLGAPQILYDSVEAPPPSGHPAMRRWGGIPGMTYTGRGTW